MVNTPTLDPLPVEIVRVWCDLKGWVHEAQRGSVTLFRSKHRDEVEDAFPGAQNHGKVICGPATYQEKNRF